MRKATVDEVPQLVALMDEFYAEAICGLFQKH
jgi:hypothetical protein